MKYTEHILSNPQTEPAFGHSQIKNNAGGFAFQATDEQQLVRFITLGTEGGTYYASERKLTQDNAKTIIEMIKRNGETVVSLLNEYHNRVPKQDALLFVLALACTHGNEATKKKAYSSIEKIAHTSTHLFTFVGYVNELRGWSRGLRTGVSNWYNNKSPEKVAYQLVKYRQRNGWTHKDVLRLSHASSVNNNLLYKYAVGKAPALETGSALIAGYEAAQLADKKTLINLITENRLTWEMIPTAFLKDVDVQMALLQNMPVMATIRNLNRFAASGLTASNLSEASKIIKARLTNQQEITKSGIHPVFALNALTVYGQGRGEKGSLIWTPNNDILEALEDTFELSYGNVESSGKNILLGVDTSASMTHSQVNGMALTPRAVSAALMSVTLRNEPNVDVVWFDTKGYPVQVNRKLSYKEILTKMNQMPAGGTDLSIPMLYAQKVKNVKFDAIVTYTDNETWAGKSHPVQEFDKYKRISGSCKAVTVAMVANNVDVMPSRSDTLGVAGFDSAVPQLISNFLKG